MSVERPAKSQGTAQSIRTIMPLALGRRQVVEIRLDVRQRFHQSIEPRGSEAQFYGSIDRLRLGADLIQRRPTRRRQGNQRRTPVFRIGAAMYESSLFQIAQDAAETWRQQACTCGQPRRLDLIDARQGSQRPPLLLGQAHGLKRRAEMAHDRFTGSQQSHRKRSREGPQRLARRPWRGASISRCRRQMRGNVTLLWLVYTHSFSSCRRAQSSLG